MRASEWIAPPVESLLDVGCNVGAWLQECARRYPGARLAGVDINEQSVAKAHELLPAADIRRSGAEQLPFADENFQYVTCLEVLEHLPPGLRSKALGEMRRVLKPGGRLILSVPHAGWFAWLDSNNIRFRLPRLYRRAVGRGRRDQAYDAMGRHVEWHQHFTLEELEQLAGGGWKLIGVRRGGLFLYSLMDWLSWPFYRAGAGEKPIRRLFERLGGWDYSINYGRASYGILVVLQRAPDPANSNI